MPGLSIEHKRKAWEQVEQAELWTNLGVVATGIIGMLAGYFAKRTSKPITDPVVAGVGFELGNRMQTEQLIAALNRIGDILEGKEQAKIEGDLKEILERLDRKG